MNEEARKRIDDLFRRYAAGVGRYALIRIGSPELAEEITARVFLSVVRNIHQQHGSAVGWLWAIVRTELSRHHREPVRQAYPQDAPSTELMPLDQLERRERDALLTGALKNLPDAEQQLISLKFFLGLSNVEIAETVGLTPGNVGVKLHRALKELRRRLEPQNTILE